jgi:predicted dehydrogenase
MPSRPGAVVVGSGFGCRVHVPALRAAGFEVRALVGQDAERTKRRADRSEVPHACTSLADALAIDRVNAVTIATPPDTHAALAIEACAAGKHVVCEKPFALDAPEAARMLAAAEDARVTHLVGHEFRWTPERAVTARALHNGLIGDLRMFTHAQYVALVADPAARVPRWWFDTARGGGWLGASGSHLIDQIRVWAGEIASVSAALPTVGAGRTKDHAEDTFVVRLTTRDGAEGVLQQTAASWTPAPRGLTMLAGTEGTLEVDGDTVWLSDASGRRALPVPAELALPAALGMSTDTRERFTHIELGPYTRLCEALRAAIEGRPPSSPVAPATFADGLAEMHVMDAIRASARADGAVMPVLGERSGHARTAGH